MKTYPTPSVMLTGLTQLFGHATVQRMISEEVCRCGCSIMRMQAVGNLWERHVATAYVSASVLRPVVRLCAHRGARRIVPFARSAATPAMADAFGSSIRGVRHVA